MAETFPLQSALIAVLETSVDLQNAQFGVLSVYDAARNVLEPRASVGFEPGWLSNLDDVRPFVGAAAPQNRSRVVVVDTDSDPGFAAGRDAARSAGFRAVQTTPIITRDGELLGALSVCFAVPTTSTPAGVRLADLCARHAADTIENVHSRRELRDTDRRRDEFVATLAHELRGPLAPIMSAVTLLGFGRIDAATRESSRGVIERQVQQLVRLVDDLLDVSRITTGKLDLRRQVVAIGQIVRSAVETNRPFLDQRQQQLHLALPDEPVFVDGDPARLAQVFSNLLNNAAKYSQIGGLIAIDILADAEGLSVRITDSGLGIPEDQLQSVFEPFTQVDRGGHGSQGGLGIGLTLAKRLVEMHGGHISAISPGLGLGSVFAVWLPTAKTEGDQATESQAKGAARHRILVVDDNRDSVGALAALLSVLGHEVRTAFDGPGALAAAETFKPNIALLDIGMPGMDGCELARRLRADPRLAGLRLVAVTGWGQPGDRARTREAGFDHHLVKPANIGQLQEILGAA